MLQNNITDVVHKHPSFFALFIMFIINSALKTNKTSVEEFFYVTNEVGKYEELAQAVRGHWQVETNNHIRDVSLQEDKMR